MDIPEVVSQNITLFPTNIGLMHKGIKGFLQRDPHGRSLLSHGQFISLPTGAISYYSGTSLCDFAVIRGLRFKFSVLL